MGLIKKTDVCTGVYWVEILEADLRILCGCPADSVKHLSKKGLINTVEVDGMSFETGPNAILLADTSVQNGQFSNLAEFPVLQMLYKQGMMIPGHPNNTGQKPKLIGIARQIRSQLQYIHRGNYGLVSKEEMRAAGFADDSLEDAWRMKLQFAFGAIKSPEEILDVVTLSATKQEITDGVFIERLKTNRYRISYQDETLDVDLNLQPHEVYPTPYQLNYHMIRREYFSVIHSGGGDGWDVNRPTMSSMLSFQGSIYLVDAGPNLLANLISLGVGVEEIAGVFHTHSHDDHFAGLPVLMRSDHKIKYFASKPVRMAVTKKLCALLEIEESDFEDYFDVCDLDLDCWNQVGDLEVMPLFSPHPVETNCFVFRVLSENRYLSFAHFADIASFEVLDKMAGKKDGSEVSQSFIEEVKQRYLAPADIKKLDVGGGMIHGNALDFSQDGSQKIILAHRDDNFSDEERQIGEGAPFGTDDVLIPVYPDHQAGFWRQAEEMLCSYFPSVPKEKLKPLLNNPVKVHNPESILLKEGEASSYISLMLTGFIEMLNAREGVRSTLSSGAMIGEILSCNQALSRATYRAQSYLYTLEIPCEMLQEFIRRNDLYEEMFTIQDGRLFLQNHWLFGESIAFSVQNRIAKTIESVSVPGGQTLIEKNTNFLYLLAHGSLTRMLGDYEVDQLMEGECFGEESAMFKLPSVHHFVADKDSELYRIPGEAIQEIPIVRWKLFELMRRRNALQG